MALDGVLRECDCQAFDRVLDRNRQALELAYACKECDVDVDTYIAKLEEQIQVARKMKAKFFPNNP